ncbi:TraM recognition domain-containing protein [Acidithiobacillus ferrivorans]|nr:TraM recognition domain-containing protein [Acidithiobacillus ferrivorans]
MIGGQNLYVHDDGAVRHEFGMGKSGGGKTQYLKHRLRQQMMRGGGAMVIDAKDDYEFLDDIWSMARVYGREYDVRVINIDDPAISHSYNPLLRGDGEAVTDRFINTVEVGTNASGEHFRTQARIALLPTITALKFLGMPYNATDLYILMRVPKAMEWLMRELRTKDRHSEEYLNYYMFVDSNRKHDKASDSYEINMAFLNTQIGGVAGRLLPYGSSGMGKIMNTYSPEVDLLEAIASNQIVILMLPQLEKSESAMSFARMFLSDFRSCIASIYRDPLKYRPIIPYEVYLDEFGSYAMTAVAPLFEMARGANIELMPFFQTVANLTRLGEEFAIQVMENTESQLFLNLGGKDSRNTAAEISGEVLRFFKSVTSSKNYGKNFKSEDRDVFDGKTETSGTSMGLKQAYDYLVRPEVFASLGLGEAIYICEGMAYKVKLPLIRSGFVEKYHKITYETRPVVGPNLRERFPREFANVQENAPPI